MLVLEKNALHFPNGPTFGGDQNRQFPQHFDVAAPLHCWHFAKYSPIPYCSTTPVPSQFLHLATAHWQSRCHFLHTQQTPSSPLIDIPKSPLLQTPQTHLQKLRTTSAILERDSFPLLLRLTTYQSGPFGPPSGFLIVLEPTRLAMAQNASPNLLDQLLFQQ